MAPPRKYSPELRECAVRMVFDVREQTGERTGSIARVTDQLGAAVPGKAGSWAGRGWGEGVGARLGRHVFFAVLLTCMGTGCRR
ncbi:hypothetical protein GCM10022254_44610 [Actinomadura meridiana]|uniref:Transposase n=1 Tax=Actinomadura meridiana TaxID=559626 RepID=A0ABP8C9K2_9ACTN